MGAAGCDASGRRLCPASGKASFAIGDRLRVAGEKFPFQELNSVSELSVRAGGVLGCGGHPFQELNSVSVLSVLARLEVCKLELHRLSVGIAPLQRDASKSPPSVTDRRRCC